MVTEPPAEAATWWCKVSCFRDAQYCHEIHQADCQLTATVYCYDASAGASCYLDVVNCEDNRAAAVQFEEDVTACEQR